MGLKLRAWIVRILPSKWEFGATTIFPFILLKKDYVPRHPKHEVLMCHESIHLFQQREQLLAGAIIFGVLAVVKSWWWLIAVYPFPFALYVLEYLVRLLVFRDRNYAYYTISFEVEAYQNQYDQGYLTKRRIFAFLKWMFKSNTFNVPPRFLKDKSNAKG